MKIHILSILLCGCSNSPSANPYAQQPSYIVSIQGSEISNSEIPREMWDYFLLMGLGDADLFDAASDLGYWVISDKMAVVGDGGQGSMVLERVKADAETFHIYTLAFRSDWADKSLIRRDGQRWKVVRICQIKESSYRRMIDEILAGGQHVTLRSSEANSTMP